jgi:hypothetical protein
MSSLRISNEKCVARATCVELRQNGRSEKKRKKPPHSSRLEVGQFQTDQTVETEQARAKPMHMLSIHMKRNTMSCQDRGLADFANGNHNMPYLA